MTPLLWFLLGVCVLALMIAISERPRRVRPSWRNYFEHCPGCTVRRTN